MRFPTAAVLSYTLLAFGNVSQAALHPPFYLQVYDDVLDISWMQDTNFVQTSCFANNALWQAFDLTTIANNSGRSKAQICSDGGALNWYEAEAWIAHLNANNYLGVNTWRQWAVPDPTNDTTCDLQNAGGTDIDWGYNCTASELGHLFNVTLGNPNNLDNKCLSPPETDPDHCLQNKGPFFNFMSRTYWSSTELALGSPYALSFDIAPGYQYFFDKLSVSLFVWPVHSGPAVAVPPPTTPILNALSINGFNVSGSWSAENALGYKLWYKDAKVVGSNYISVDLGPATSYSIDLYDKASFYVAISAYNSASESLRSNTEWFELGVGDNEIE